MTALLRLLRPGLQAGLLTALLAALAACQSPATASATVAATEVGASRQGPVVSVYPTRGDASAVASGRLGSMPVTFEYETALAAVADAPCDPLVIQVKTAKGQVGWAVRRSFTQLPCDPAFNAASDPALNPASFDWLPTPAASEPGQQRLPAQSSSACNCTSR